MRGHRTARSCVAVLLAVAFGVHPYFAKAQSRNAITQYVFELITKPHLTLEEVERAEGFARQDRSLAWWAGKVRQNYEDQQRRAAQAENERTELEQVPQLCKTIDNDDRKLQEQLLRDDAIGEIVRQGNAGNTSDACPLIAAMADKLETDRQALVECSKAVQASATNSEVIKEYRNTKLFRASVVHADEQNLKQLAEQFKCAD